MSSAPIFVINGFYMAMREKYTKPGASISYLVVEWDSAALSWADFRGKVLGATDPTQAAEGSLRREILQRWKELGLASEPNVGDNGVHASASPFEALAERLNWLGATLPTDGFGKALHEAGIPTKAVMEWTKDPQVDFDGKKGSLFDLLEDLDAGECLAKAQKIAGVSGPLPAAKNQAFVFVKPHAVTPATVALVVEGLQKAGITVTTQGTLDHATIEAKLLIDNHYYAIANKASLTKPKDLNPPAAKQEDFQKMFGLSWADALAQGRVYNAVDACTALGIDGEQMDVAWAATKKANQLVKFGGGFYCGLVAPPKPVAPQPLFVINGFYMAMREKYTKAGASISYLLADWDPAALPWADFRGKVLGATDPTTAAEGSVRRAIFQQWKELGLKAEPDVGDNGVHASASPFEALAERLNWVGATVETDAFGAALLAANIPKATILQWTKDPQVDFEGKKGSLFDLLEDLNADECLAKAQKIAGVSGPLPAAKNQAFVFVKPHAVTPATVLLVKNHLASAGVTVTDDGVLDSHVIESKQLIDNHYYAIANKAALTQPKDLNPPQAKQEDFQKLFGVSWADALAQGRVHNAVDACKTMGIDGEQMDGAWAAAKKANRLVKFGGGFYCGLVDSPKAPAAPKEIFVINGFYMAMREKYTKAGASISYLLADWDPVALSWVDFRGKVLGATDPTTAADGSVRRAIFQQWKELGLKAEPDVGDNGVHASASPFEALAERLNWVGATVETDAFGAALLAANIPKATILQWTKDPQVDFEGKKGSLFDLLEDLNADECLAKAQKIAGVSGPLPAAKNQAFVFVKPHAVTPATVLLVKNHLASAGVTVTDDGVLDSHVIESKQLIDNHYYAIANKAALTQPKDLNPPQAKQEDFQKLFGVSWADALAQGRVYNAVDACSALGIDGERMDGIWAAAKKANKLVKFGGGFYCGLVSV